MKRSLFLLAVTMVGGMVAVAQETAPVPVAEVGLNYSYTNTRPGSGAPSFGSQGGSGTFIYNINGTLGVVADLGGYHNGQDANFDPTTFSYSASENHPGSRPTFKRCSVELESLAAWWIPIPGISSRRMASPRHSAAVWM